MRTSTSRIRIAAAAPLVWAALTEPEQVRRWQYGSELETDWSVGSAISFRVVFDERAFAQWGTVLSYEPPVSLSYRLYSPRPGLEDRPENAFVMTYHLEPIGADTELTITQVDPRPGEDAAEETEDGDSAVLRALKALVEDAGT